MTKNNKKLITSFILFLIVVISFIFIFIINKKQTEEIFKIRDQMLQKNIFSNNDQIAQKIKELKNKEDQIQNFLVDKNNPILLIELIESIGKNLLLQTSVSKIEEVDNNLVFDITVSGSIDSITSFVSNLESSDKKIIINNIRINKNVSEKNISWVAYINGTAITK